MMTFMMNYCIFTPPLILLLMTLILKSNIFMMIYFLMIFFSTILFTHNKLFSPLIMNIQVILSTIMMSLYFNMILNTNWFSTIMFLIMIGGMMILFLYFNSFMMNEISNFKAKTLFNMVLKTYLLTISMILLFFKNNMYFSMNYLKNNYLNFNNNELFTLSLMNNHNFYSLSLMIIYILICLSIITFICMGKNFSLRKLN